MKSLIVHIGPPKCGSTSIQSFFSLHERPCVQKTSIIILDVETLNSLNQDKIENSDYIDLFEEKISEADHLIVSHESLFHSPKALENICRIASSKVSKIIIVGYCRKVSEFMISAYNQWGFRSSNNYKNIEKIMLENEINPLHFLGVEKHLLSKILTDFPGFFIANWFHSYGNIEKLVYPYNIEVKVGTLPTNKTSESLVQYFCKASNLTLKEQYKKNEQRANIKFNSTLTESIKIASEMGLNIPGPHSNNEFLKNFSSIINSELIVNDEFLCILKEYIDSYFLESNINFSRNYNLDKNYFSISKQYSKKDIIDIIRMEERRRIADDTLLKKYRQLAGVLSEACFQYYKTQAVQKNLTGLI